MKMLQHFKADELGIEELICCLGTSNLDKI